MMLFILFRLSSPLFLGYLIAYFTSNPYESSTQDAYLFAGGLILGQFITLFLFHPFMLYIFQTAMKLRIACCSLIYDKVQITPGNFQIT